MDPRSLQAYGIGLALVCLLWVAVRIGLQSNPRAQALLNPGFYALDRIVLPIVVCGYTLLSLNGAIPSVLEELSVFTPDVRIQQAILEWRTQVGGPGGWALLGILAVALTLGLREQWRRSRVLAILLLSLSAPLLIAARFSTDLSTGTAVRGAWQDPGRPWWSAGVVLAASVLLGMLAIRVRGLGCVYASGLTANIIGILIWIGLGPGTMTSLILTNTLCFALASLFWFVIEIVLRHRPEPIALSGGSLPFAHAATLCSLMLLGSQVCIFLMSSFSNPGVSLAGNLAWTALAAAFAALALSLWDPQAQFTFQGMYAAGLMATGMALYAARLFPRDLCWTASLTLSVFVLFMAALRWLAPQFGRLGQLLRVPDRQKG